MIHIFVFYIFLAVILHFLDLRESLINRPPYLYEKRLLIKVFYILLLPLKIISRIKRYKRRIYNPVLASAFEEEMERKKAAEKFLEKLLNDINVNEPIDIDIQVKHALKCIKKEDLIISDKELDDFIDKIFKKYLEREKMIKNSLQQFVLQANSEKPLEEQLFEWENKENLNLSHKERSHIDFGELQTAINRNIIFKDR